MATRLEGWDAIAFAEQNGCTLSVHARGDEAARDGVGVDEAKKIARSAPDRVFIDVDEGMEGTRVA